MEQLSVEDDMQISNTAVYHLLLESTRQTQTTDGLSLTNKADVSDILEQILSLRCGFECGAQSAAFRTADIDDHLMHRVSHGINSVDWQFNENRSIVSGHKKKEDKQIWTEIDSKSRLYQIAFSSK